MEVIFKIKDQNQDVKVLIFIMSVARDADSSTF